MPASSSTAKVVETTSKEEDDSKEDDDTAELARFRQEWLTELHRRKAELPGTVTRPGTTASRVDSAFPTKDPAGQIFRENEPSLEATSSREVVPNRRILATHPALNDDGHIAPSYQISKALESALNIYRRAVALEQQGELDQAILFYRQAFRLVCAHLFANGIQPCLRCI